MKVGIAIWQGSVSNVFDFSHKLLVVEFENGIEKSRQEIDLTEQSGLERAARLRSLGVDVLICGAISRPLANIVNGSGINLLPFVSGSTDQILAAYVEGRLGQAEYAMPGFWPGARRCFKRRRGRGGGKRRMGSGKYDGYV